MTSVCHLPRLSLAAVGGAPHEPVLIVAYSITGIPEFGSDAGVCAITQHLPEFAILDLVTDFGAELEVVALIVNGPGAIRFHVDAIVRVSNQIVVIPCARFDAHIRHADDRDTIPS